MTTPPHIPSWKFPDEKMKVCQNEAVTLKHTAIYFYATLYSIGVYKSTLKHMCLILYSGKLWRTVTVADLANYHEFFKLSSAKIPCLTL